VEVVKWKLAVLLQDLQQICVIIGPQRGILVQGDVGSEVGNGRVFQDYWIACHQHPVGAVLQNVQDCIW